MKYLSMYDLVRDGTLLQVKPEEVEVMYHYFTRGRGWEEDHLGSRSTYFHDMDESGQWVYGLNDKDSSELADCFWFGGVGYISGWATLRMLRCTNLTFHQGVLESFPERFSGESIRNMAHRDTCPTDLAMNINEYSGLPSKRWYVPSLNAKIEREEVVLVITGQKCVCKVDNEYDRDLFLRTVQPTAYSCLRCIEQKLSELDHRDSFRWYLEDHQYHIGRVNFRCSKCGSDLPEMHGYGDCGLKHKRFHVPTEDVITFVKWLKKHELKLSWHYPETVIGRWKEFKRSKWKEDPDSD